MESFSSNYLSVYETRRCFCMTVACSIRLTDHPPFFLSFFLVYLRLQPEEIQVKVVLLLLLLQWPPLDPFSGHRG